jgi:hypothetical protein
MTAPRSTVIWYATAPGQEADDGVGDDSPFATAMARHMRVPEQSIYDFFNKTGWDVFQATNQGQQPWLAASPIPGVFYFLNRAGNGSEFVPFGSDQSQYQRRDVPLSDFRRGIFLNGLTSPTRKFAFGESYQVVNGKLDSSFQIDSWDVLPVAGEYGGDDVRYFWVRLSTLPSVQAVFAQSSTPICIDPQSYICFFFKERLLFHISIRFLKINECKSYGWIVSSLLGNESDFTLSGGAKTTRVVYHEESQWSILDIFWVGITNDSANMLRG